MAKNVLPASYATANDASTALTGQPGALYEQMTDSGLKTYLYAVTKTALVKGDVPSLFTNAYTVAVSGVALRNLNSPAGVALTSVSADKYTFLQVGGPNAYILTDGGVAAGDLLVSDAADSGTADTFVNATNSGVPFGIALAADSGSILVNAIITLK